MNDKNEPFLLEDNDCRKESTSTGKNNKLQHQQNLQSNKQDLDQTVELDVKPSQVNMQHIDLTINNKIDNYSGKIIGSVFIGTEGKLVSGAEILLYFGSATEFPVYRTISDENGNYSIEDLPPGFYTIVATFKCMQCILRNVKVLPGENSQHSLTLMPIYNYHSQDNW